VDQPGLTVSESAIRRDRAVTAAGLVGVAALAWVWVVRTAAPGLANVGAAMAGMPGMSTAASPGIGWLAGMWAVMMVAMMLPSATPTILLFGSVARRRRLQGQPAVPVAVFALGYLAVWIVYAIVAGAAQWELHRVALLSPAMAAGSPAFAGGLLIAAGIYQWLPVKGTCLSHCRSPLGFFATEWREGIGGALAMGMRHGTYCVGCCWLLMALLFVAGVMNLAWVAIIAGFVLVEKLVPRGDRLGRLAGLGLVLWGAWLIGDRFL
jgi:predicted metal-binding membrane protein